MIALCLGSVDVARPARLDFLVLLDRVHGRRTTRGATPVHGTGAVMAVTVFLFTVGVGVCGAPENVRLVSLDKAEVRSNLLQLGACDMIVSGCG